MAEIYKSSLFFQNVLLPYTIVGYDISVINSELVFNYSILNTDILVLVNRKGILEMQIVTLYSVGNFGS